VRLVDSRNGAFVELSSMLLQDMGHRRAECARQDILRTSLNDAWTVGAGQGEDYTEVQVMSEHYVAMLAGPLDNLSVLGARIADAGPVR